MQTKVTNGFGWFSMCILLALVISVPGAVSLRGKLAGQNHQLSSSQLHAANENRLASPGLTWGTCWASPKIYSLRANTIFFISLPLFCCSFELTRGSFDGKEFAYFLCPSGKTGKDREIENIEECT